MFIECVSFRPRPNCAEVWTMRGLTLKMHQMLTVHNTLKKLENTTILTILVLCLCKTRVRKSHHYHEVIILEKLCFKMHGSPSTLKRKVRVLFMVWSEGALEKLRFCDGLLLAVEQILEKTSCVFKFLQRRWTGSLVYIFVDCLS